MSHFSVALITREEPTEALIDRMMAPYNEELVRAPAIIETKEQYIQKKREELENYRNGLYAEYAANPEEYEEKNKNHPRHLEYIRNFIVREYSKTDEGLFAERANLIPRWDDKDLEYGEDFLDAEGNLWSTKNTDGKWDYYVIGGGWENTIPIGRGKNDGVNTAQIKDINFGTDVDVETLVKDENTIKEYEGLITKGDYLMKASYFKKKYPTIEDYVKLKALWITFAIMDPNGIWHETGKMLGFGVSTATPDDERIWAYKFCDFFKELDPEWYVTVIDCHT